MGFPWATLLKGKFHRRIWLGKEVLLTGWLSLKVSFPVNSGRRKEVFCDGGALGVYKVRLKVDR